MEISAVTSRSKDGPDRSLAQISGDGADAAVRLPRAPANGLAMSLERRRLQFYLLLVLADVAVILGSFAVANGLYPRAFVNHEAMLPAYMLLPLFQTIAFYNATYSRDGLTNWRLSAWRGLLALLISALLFNFFAFFAKTNAEFSRVVFVSGLAGAWAGMILVRIALSRFIHAHWGPSATNRLVIEAGGPPVALPNVYRVNAIDHGLRPDTDDPLALDRLSKYLANMDMVIVSCGPEQRLAWSEVLRGSGIHGEVISDFAQEIGALAIVRHEAANVTALVVSRGHLGLRARVTKRAFDTMASMLALVVLAPVLLVCALAITLDDGGPVFFRQRRMGRGNQLFDIVKFRTMRIDRADAHGTRSAARDDDRITRVGGFLRRTSLDELPQLINVFKGDMSTGAARLSAAQPDAAVSGRPAGAAAGLPQQAGDDAMIARICWIAAMLALAVVATFAQIDRAARFAPHLSPLVPTMFRGFAQQKLTEMAVAAELSGAPGQSRIALPLAQRLALVRPLPAEHLTLLSQAALLAEDQETAVAALEEAGTRGWRDPVVQRTLALSALQDRNWEAASQRIAALLATMKYGHEVTDPLLDELTQTAGGRAALARRLAAGGYWQRNFVVYAASALPAETYADVIVRAQELNAPLDCGALGSAANILRQRRSAASADRFWPGDCPGA